MRLFKQLYNRRLLIKLFGIKFHDLVGGDYQINLFDDSEATGVNNILLYKKMSSKPEILILKKHNVFLCIPIYAIYLL